MVAPRLHGIFPVALLIMVSLLAGCLGDDDAKPGPQTADLDEGAGSGNLTFAGGERPSVEGFVQDESRLPLAGAVVVLQNEGTSATTDANGHYSFSGLLDNQQYVLIAQMDGYHKKAQQVVAIDEKIVRLDFVLTEIPVAEPHMNVLERAGFISCQFFAGAGHDHGGNGTEFEQGCGDADPNEAQVLEFEMDPGVVGIVIETQWDAAQPLADFFMVTVESVGYGDLDKQFGQVIAPSIIKIEIPQEDVAKYYGGNGGLLRVIVDVHFEDDDEQAAGAAFAFQEDFTVRVSRFFVQPQPKDYSAFAEG